MCHFAVSDKVFWFYSVVVAKDVLCRWYTPEWNQASTCINILDVMMRIICYVYNLENMDTLMRVQQ